VLCPEDSQSCQAPLTAARNRNSEEVWAEICLRGKNQVKRETDFQEGKLSNESLKSHQEKHAVKDSHELVGGEVVLQHILNSSC